MAIRTAALPPPDATPWSPFRRHLGAVIFILGLLAVLVFISAARQTLMMGFLLAFLLYRPVRWASRRLRYSGAVALFHLVLFVLLVLLVVGALGWLSGSAAGLQQQLSTNLSSSPLQPVLARLETSGSVTAVGGAITGLIASIAGLVGVAFVAIILSFWLLNDMWSRRGALRRSLVGDGVRQVSVLLRRLDQIWIGYLTAEIIFGLIMTVASLVEFWLLGVPFFILMAVLTGLLTLIPSIGGLIASLVVAIPCLVLGSTRFPDMDPVAFTILVTAVNVITTQVSYNLIAVPIIGRFVRLPASVVLISVLVPVIMGDFLLAFLIVPILSSLSIAGGYLMAKSTGRDPYPEELAPAVPEEGLFGQLIAAPPVMAATSSTPVPGTKGAAAPKQPASRGRRPTTKARARRKAR
ncbi:MAG TPA: AI-2E family transporter [Anaerolineales bacterium]|nr:AI-2E family transporter [Anaerolineales bacterium]